MPCVRGPNHEQQQQQLLVVGVGGPSCWGPWGQRLQSAGVGPSSCLCAAVLLHLVPRLDLTRHPRSSRTPRNPQNCSH